MSLEVSENGTIRKHGYGFLFAFQSNYGPILYHFRYKARCCSKIAIFSYPTYTKRRRRGWPRLNFAQMFSMEKQNDWGTMCWRKYEGMLRRFDTIPERVGQTDGQKCLLTQ